MRTYPACKPTTVAWLPEIPKHWELQPFRRVSSEINRKNDDGAIRPMLSLSAYRGIEPKEWEYAEQARLQEDSLAYKVVAPDQLVINPMWCVNGAVAVSQLDGIVSPAYRVYRLCAGLRPRFADYLFRSHFYIKEYNLHVRGSTTYDRSVGKEAFNRLPVVIPPEQEQDAIVAFLEAKERDIQTFIANKRRTIELLKEQKTALINRAVTRGLNPTVPLKPAGIPWIGDIPKHWTPVRVRSLVSSIDQGVSPQTVEGMADETGWGVLKSGCVNNGVFREDEHKRLPEGFPIDPEIVVCVGDVLVSRASGSADLVGSVGRVVSLTRQLILSDKNFRLNFKNKRIIDFVVWAMNAWYYRKHLQSVLSGAEGLPSNLPLSELRNLVVAVPPADEAEAIASFVAGAVQEIAQGLLTAGREIELMEEYCITLIAAAVTGKIDVRDVDREV